MGYIYTTKTIFEKEGNNINYYNMDIDNNNTNNNVDEDPIVEEIDVHLIFPRGELYTLDYPIPSVTNKYFQPTNARVRPNHSMLEVVYDTSEWTKSQFFNKEFVSGSGAN